MVFVAILVSMVVVMIDAKMWKLINMHRDHDRKVEELLMQIAEKSAGSASSSE